MQRIYGVFAAATFAAIMVPTICLLAITPGQHNRRALAHKVAALIFYVTGVTPRVSGRENLPSEPCVVVANHASYLDGIILTAVLPPRFTFVIKREMAGMPLAGFMLRRLGSAFVERFDRHRSAIDARHIMQIAATGESLTFFPEGTFRREPGLRRFHNGAFVAAKRSQLALVPIVIRGSRDILPAGRMLPVPGTIEVTINAPITPDQAGPDAIDPLAACRKSILKGLNEPDLQQ